jgi:PAS domain S-box-containing protein
MVGDPSVEPALRAAVLRQIEKDGGPNLGHYKTSSLDRRLLGRLEAVGCDGLADYVARLERDAEERRELVEALMVGVTSFFRDPPVFAAVRSHVADPLLCANTTSEIRVWSAACSTGQEPYSLAILFAEAAEAMRKPLRLRVFATDISSRALAVASAGIYDEEGLQGLDEKRRDRWFLPIGSGQWKVRDELRQMVTFARHDITHDPAFPKMDLVCARNLLIYLNHDGQDRALQLFHFAMLPSGVLAVGESELTTGHRDLFRPLPTAPGLLRKVPANQPTPRSRSCADASRLDNAARGSAGGASLPESQASRRRLGMTDLLEAWLQQRGGSGLFLDNHERVLFAFGDVWQYLPPPRGQLANFTLGDLPNEALRIGLRDAVRRAAELGATRRFSLPGGADSPSLPGRVDPFRLPGGDTCYLLVLEPDATDQPFVAGELDLAATAQEYLGHMETRCAQLEATLQEEQALRNDGEERLRATNEELRAANEEQQSINEELRATTEELREKVAELSRAKQDIERTHDALSATEAEKSAILDHLEEGVLYLGKDLRCQWVNPAAAKLADRPPEALQGRYCYEALFGAEHVCPDCPALDVLKTGQSHERAESCMPNGRMMRMAASPVRDEHGRLVGVVQHYHDITEELRMAEELAERERLFRAMYESSPLAIQVFDPDGRLRHANPACLSIFGTVDRPDDLARLNLFEHWHLDEPQAEDLRAGRTVRAHFTVDFSQVRENNLYWTSRNDMARMEMTVTPLRLSAADPTVLGYLSQIEEITRRYQAERERERTHRQYREVFENANTILVRTGPTLAIEDLNPEAERVLGVKRAEVLGHNYAELFVPSSEARAELVGLASRALGGDPVQGYVQQVTTPVGETRTCLWNKVRATDEEGRPVGLILSGVDVTERHRLEERRREENEKLLEAERTAKIGHWQWLEGHGEATFSEGASRVFGLETHSGVIDDETFWSLIHPDDRGAVERANSMTLSTGQSREVTYRVCGEDGSLRHVRETQHPLRDPSGQVIGIRGAILDITAMRQAEEFWRLALDSVGDGVWERNPRTGDAQWSDSWYRMLGYEPGEIPASYRNLRAMIHEDDRALVEQAVEACMTGERDTYTAEFRMRHKNGHWVWILARGRIMAHDESGRPSRFVGTHMDISVRKEVERKLARRQRDLQEIMEGTSPVVGEELLEGLTLHLASVLGMNYLFVSENVPGQDGQAKMIAFRGPEGMLRPCQYPLAGSPSAEVFAGRTLVYEDGVTQDFPDDEQLLLLGIRGYIGVPLRASDGEVLGMMGALSAAPLEDVGFVKRVFLIFAARASAELEQRRMVAELRDSEQRLRQVVENMPVLVTAHDAEGRFVFWNAECERVSGYGKDEIVGNGNATRLLYANGAGPDAVAEESNYRNVECVLNTKSGDTRTILWSNISRQWPIPGWARWAIGIDITEQRKYEEGFRQAQKMSAIGELAAGVAHDFNNLLHVIFGSNEQFQEAPCLDEGLRQASLGIQQAAKRGSELVKQLMYFSRRETFHPEAQDLNALIQQSLSVLRRGTGESVEIVFTPIHGACTAKVDAGQVGQVLLNLCLNARDAMKGRSGRIDIRTRRTVLTDEEALPRGLTAGNYVTIDVADDGNGIPPHIREQVFEPFFTTKGKAHGSGLGLASAYAIMERHGGGIAFDTAVGEGSTFHLFFPVVRDRAREAVLPSASLPAAGRGKLLAGRTILVAEDDPLVLRLSVRGLEAAGATVLPVPDGAAAVKAFRHHADTVDAVLLDAIMPKMNGREAYMAILEIRPATPALFASGYSADVLHDDLLRGLNVEVIQKPCVPREIVAKLVKLLGDA